MQRCAIIDEDVAHDGDADSMKYSMFAEIKEVERSPGIKDYDDDDGGVGGVGVIE